MTKKMMIFQSRLRWSLYGCFAAAVLSPSKAFVDVVARTTTATSSTLYHLFSTDYTALSMKQSGGAPSPKKRKQATMRTAGKGFGSGSGSGRSVVDTFPYTGTIRPGKQSPQKVVTDPNIIKPDYAETGRPVATRPRLPWIIEVKTPEEIVKMRAAGALAREILDLAGRAVMPGVTTDDIDHLVHNAIVERGAYPSPLNYHRFPKSCCTSVNEVICHGIPDDRQLQSGDIINIDITVYSDGYHGDCSEMFYVGNVDECDAATKRLLQTTYDGWITACQFVRPGRDYQEIGGVIEDYVTARGFTTVHDFCGHGIGRLFQTTPDILHYRNQEANGQMAAGHVFTIEPMICEGSSAAKVVMWPDQWTATTVDGKRSAQFEHTLLLTLDGVEALTAKTNESPLQFWEVESAVHPGVWVGTTPAARQRQEVINAWHAELGSS